MRMLRSIVLCGVEGKELPFRFDTGAVGTQLQVRYYELFHGEIGSWKEGEEINSGVGGAVRRKIFIQPKLDLMVGDKTATLKDVTILPVKLNSDLDEFYGNLGQDFVAGFESFTLDFSKMTFSFGARRTAQRGRWPDALGPWQNLSHPPPSPCRVTFLRVRCGHCS